MLSLDLTPKLSFEPRFYMLIIYYKNVYYKKSKHLVIGLLFHFVLMNKIEDWNLRSSFSTLFH